MPSSRSRIPPEWVNPPGLGGGPPWGGETTPPGEWANPMPHPLLMMDGDASLRAFVQGTSAVLPHPLVQMDEELTCRIVAQQLGRIPPAVVPPTDHPSELLWEHVPRGI
jgi:hypothetical protein